MDAVTARAPVRIDLAGGTVDVWPLPYALPAPVVTVGAALDLPCRVRIRRRGDGAFRLKSRDRGAEAAFPSRGALEAAAAARREPLALVVLGVAAGWTSDEGLDVEVEAFSPAGAGLGGSSALLVALLGALDGLAGREREPAAHVRLAQEIETTLLAGPTGYQDYHPALLGGCLALEGGIGGPRVERLDVDLGRLAARLRLLHTGAPHVSAVPNGAVLADWLRGEPAAVEGLEAVRRAAEAVRACLRAGDLDGALEGVVAEGRARRRLAPGVETEATRAIDAVARGAGALGTKILGAGGGGSVLVVLPAGAPADVDARLAAGPGRLLPLALTPAGLVVEPA